MGAEAAYVVEGGGGAERGRDVGIPSSIGTLEHNPGLKLFKPLDPTDFTSNMWYFPRISQKYPEHLR